MTILPQDRRPEPASPRNPWLAMLVILILLTAALSWPVIAHLSSRIPGTATWAFDESTFVWNIWYFKHALLDLHVNPLHSDLIWHPLGIDLVLYTYNFLNVLIALPLQVAFNLPLASNVVLLLSTVLSGLGASALACYVLCRAYSDRKRVSSPLQNGQSAPPNLLRAGHSKSTIYLAAFLAGLVYAFASSRAVYAALGHYDMVTTQALPFYTLYLLKTLHERRLRNAGLAGLFFALAALAEMTFATLLVLLTVIILFLVIPKLRSRWTALGRMAVAGAVALLLWSPVLAPIVREFVCGDYALTGWGESVKLSADVVGLVTPTDLNPVLAGDRDIPQAGGAGRDQKQASRATLEIDGSTARWRTALRAVEEGKSQFSDVNTVFLGYATLGLAVLGGWLGRRWLKAWIWSAIVFGVLSLGPLLQINGRFRFSLDNLLPEGVTFPLPFAALHFIPIINANRAPNRSSVILMLALALLAAYGAAWLLGRIRKADGETSGRGKRLVWLLACLLAVMILVEHLAVPLPTTSAAIPDIYRQLRSEPGEFAVMQLPLGWRNSFGVLGSEQTQLQYFQTASGKPMIGGNISRAPATKMEYFARIPLFRALTDLEMYRAVPPDVDAAARGQAASLMALYDVRYFITTPPIAGRYPYQDTWQRAEAYALDVLPLEKPAFWQEGGYQAYRVIQPAVSLPFRLDLGKAGVEPYVGAGWDLRFDEQPYGATAIWATDTEAELYLPADGPRALTLRLMVAPLSYPGAPAQRISLAVNGTVVLRDRPLAPGWQTLEVRVPAAATRRGPNRIRLSLTWATSPRQAFPDPTSRAVIGSTGVVSPVNLDVHSFSEAFISAFAADGREIKASAGRRGYNVATLDRRTGQVLEMRGFDTAANTYEANALATYLTAIPKGRIVVLATKENATASLTPEMVAALRGLGSGVTSLSDLAGMAHALVGVRGAAPGAAAEAIASGDAFLRVAGDFRTLAAAVDWVELAP